MSNSMGLPPDIQEQRERESKPIPKREMGGIGAGAHENVRAASSRDFAMTGGAPKSEEKQEVASATEESVELVVCPNSRCASELNAEWSFCSKCGADLLRGGLERQLGISFEEDDIHDYLFKGFIVKEVKILGKNTAVMKTSQAKDLQDVDDFIMNGSWSKNENGAEKKVSDFYLRQINTLAISAACIQKINGDSIGETIEEKVLWLGEAGSALVDRLTTRVSMYNQALAEYLKKEDTLSGS